MVLQQHKKMDAIESKEIRGLSIRALAWLVSSTITIVGFVITSYFLLKNNIDRVDTKIEQVKTDKASDAKYDDYRMRIIEANLKTLEGTVDNLRNQIVTNRETIDGLKK
jgi:hypothetical protein